MYVNEPTCSIHKRQLQPNKRLSTISHQRKLNIATGRTIQINYVSSQETNL